MSGRLEGVRLLITGGARGIGRAVIEVAVREGAAVSFFDLDEDGEGEGAQAAELQRRFGRAARQAALDPDDGMEL